MGKIRYSNEQIIAALKASMGKVYIAAEKIGCDPDTIYLRAKKCKAVSQAIEAIRGKAIDTAEIALWKATQSGEAWAVCFTLKTLGKERGYIERTENSSDVNMRHSGGLTISPAAIIEAGKELETTLRRRGEPAVNGTSNGSTNGTHH